MSHVGVKWAERKDKLFVTVEASNATDVNVEFSDNSVKFGAKAITANSEPHNVQLQLNLLKTIVPASCTYKVLGQVVQILCVKAESGYWNKLVNEPNAKTKNWLSVDWNLWKDEDEEKENENLNFGGYGDMANMMNMGGADSDDEDDGAEAPAADLNDLDA